MTLPLVDKAQWVAFDGDAEVYRVALHECTVATDPGPLMFITPIVVKPFTMSRIELWFPDGAGAVNVAKTALPARAVVPRGARVEQKLVICQVEGDTHG